MKKGQPWRPAALGSSRQGSTTGDFDNFVNFRPREIKDAWHVSSPQWHLPP